MGDVADAHGVSGFIVDNLEEGVDAVQQIDFLDRAEIRAIFEERFTADRMAREYLAVYRGLPGVGGDAAAFRRVAVEHAGFQEVA